VNARESKKLIRRLIFGLIINLIDQLLMPMSVSLAPPQSGGSGTFLLATWNIRCGRNMGLAAAAKGLAQMGVGCAPLTEVKLTHDKYPWYTSGYNVFASKATSHNHRGIALLWKEGNGSTWSGGGMHRDTKPPDLPTRHGC
jgi:hypothetical protein